MSDPRVLVLTHSLSGVDGVGRYGCALLRYLAPRCRHMEVFLSRGHRGLAQDFVPRSNVDLLPTLPAGPFPFLPLPRLAWVLLHSLPALVRAARRADVVHSFSDYPMGFLAVLAARLARRPVIVSGHGTYSVVPFAMPVHRHLIGWMFRRADRFLAGADYALRRILAVAPAPRAELVPYGCVPADHDAAAARGEQPGVPEPYALCVGEVKQRKGYHTTLRAFLGAWCERPRIHLAVVGRLAQADPYLAELKARVEQAGATDHVHWLGMVSEARKVALLRGCRAFLLTPRTSDEGGFEAFGLVFLEAGAAGRPVLGCADSGAEDAITDGENGFLRGRDDTDGLARALGALFDDPALADRMGAAGRARALECTWEAAAERVRQLYDEVRTAREP